MAFIMSNNWLMEYYGSKSNQVEQTRQWLLKYGKDVPEKEIELWSQYKHLAEYQINTPDIVTKARACIGQLFESQLQAHRFINLMRVPIAGFYETALNIVRPKTILELGVGGDSAISTSVFLAYLERWSDDHYMLSVDRNRLETTLKRYMMVSFWDFIQDDSVKVLKMENQMGRKYDMVFIDTIHSYEHTMKELQNAILITNHILLDDALFEGNEFDEEKGGVKKAIKIFLDNYNMWKKVDLGNDGICLLSKEREQ